MQSNIKIFRNNTRKLKNYQWYEFRKSIENGMKSLNSF